MFFQKEVFDDIIYIHIIIIYIILFKTPLIKLSFSFAGGSGTRILCGYSRKDLSDTLFWLVKDAQVSFYL